MRYLLFCTLIFLGINSIAQNNEKHDSVITNIYADTLKSIQTDLHQNSSKHFYLIKLKEGLRLFLKSNSNHK
jgi:YbbR domain-containing protein